MPELLSNIFIESNWLLIPCLLYPFLGTPCDHIDRHPPHPPLTSVKVAVSKAGSATRALKLQLQLLKP